MRELIQQVAEWIGSTSLAEGIAGSSYLFPNLETIHVLGLALVIGTIGMVDLRLLGFASTHRTVRDVSAQMLPFAWTGFAVALLSGLAMFISNATFYVDNPAFQLKMLLLVLAGINMLVFHGRTWRSIDEWDSAPKPPTAVRLAGAVSLTCWVVIVFLGRWIGFIL
ncbi:MAG TPA: DUF6644 family protein [Povalibacter sp.]|nr:DUF6644 family protein [Povalibacter sp.]